MRGDDPNAPEPYLIRGEWRSRPVPSWHAEVQRYALTVACHLDAWHATQPEPGYEILNHGWFQLRPFPPTLVCLPLAVVRGRIPTFETNWVPGIPRLAVEVHAGRDTYGALWERVNEYTKCGVSAVWVLTPTARTVTAHRPGAEVEAFDSRHTLRGDPELPGFSCPVADFFR